MSKLPIALVAAGLIGFTAGQASAARLSQQDETFIKHASRTNLAEIQEGNLAMQNGATQSVKQMGQTLVTDHTQAEDQLRQIAQQEGFSLPQSPSRKQQAQDQKLTRETGATFDQKFAREEVKGHEKAISEFKQEAQSTQNPALRSYAETTIPVLQKHLQMAEMAARGG